MQSVRNCEILQLRHVEVLIWKAVYTGTRPGLTSPLGRGRGGGDAGSLLPGVLSQRFVWVSYTLATAHCWDVSTTPSSAIVHAVTLGTLLRYLAVDVRGCNGQGGLGCRRSGRFGDTFRLGQWVSVVWLLLHTGWSGCTWLDASFGTLRRFVLDEYDKCLDKLNMRKDVQHIFIVAPKKEQVMLFSAPITSET